MKISRISSTRERWELLETQAPSKGLAHKISFLGTHPGLWQRDGGSEQTGVMQEEIGEKARGTATIVPVQSSSCTPPINAFVPSSSIPLYAVSAWRIALAPPFGLTVAPPYKARALPRNQVTAGSLGPLKSSLGDSQGSVRDTQRETELHERD